MRQLQLAFLLLVTLFTGAAQAESFELLARQSVNSREERIVFRVGREAGRIAQLSFRTGGEPILTRSVEITFSDGQRQTVELVDWIAANSLSRAIDFGTTPRQIDQVVVWKRPSWRPGRAELQLLGVVRERWQPPLLPRQGPVAGAFETIASQTVDARSDRVVFQLNRRDGRFAKLKLRTPADWMLVNGVDVAYARGGSQRFDLVARMAPGTETRPIDLEGDARFVSTVTVWKRPGFRPGNVRLDLLGIAEPDRREEPSWGGIGSQIPRDWVLFGVQTVDFSTDRDVLRVGGDVGRFERVALRVLDNDIYLREITVVYAGGERDRKVIDTEIRANSQTRAIPLKGDRFIERIELVYRSNPERRNPAVVEVFGDFAGDWLGERGRGRERHQGWVMLGAERTSIFTSDGSGLAVGERFGRIKALRLTAKRHSVKLYGLRVIYADGGTENVAVFGELKDGETTKPIDLQGRGRFISRVELSYRPNLTFKGSGIVEIWGLH